MPGNSAGSIYAEATLDITKFTAAASQLGGEAGKIAKSMEKTKAKYDGAKSSLDGMVAALAMTQNQLASANSAFDVSCRTLSEMQEEAEKAAQSAALLGAAYEKASAAFGENSMLAFQSKKEYEDASKAADKLAEAAEKQKLTVDKNAAALDKASAKVKQYENRIKKTKTEISNLESTLSGLNAQMLNMGSDKAAKTLEKTIRTTITSSGESMGTYVMRQAGVDTTSFLGILGARGIGRVISTLGQSLPKVGLGILAVGAAAGVAGYAIYKAADKAADGVDLWQKAYESVDTERTTQFTQIVEAGITLADTDLTNQVNSVYEQIGKALTDGKPDTAAVVSEIQEASKGMFTEVRSKIQEWYDAEMANLDLSTAAGVQKAAELTAEYNNLSTKVDQLDENTAAWIASYARKSTAECQAALTTLETYEDELERLAGRAEQLTAIQESNQRAAYTTVASGVTTDETTVANATAYVQVNYQTRMNFADVDVKKQKEAIWQEYQEKLQTATTEGEKLELKAEYDLQIQQINADHEALETQLTAEYNQMLANVMQGVAEAASRSNPQLAAAIQQAISGDFTKLKELKISDPALIAAMKGFVESGVLEGITTADLSTAEGQLEAMIRLLAQGTSEYAQGAFEKLGVRETEGFAGILGSIWEGGATESQNPAQRISELAEETSAALEKLQKTGSQLDLNNVQELFRTSFDYNSTTPSGDQVTGLQRLATFIDAVSAAASAGNLDATQLQQYGAVISDIMLVLDSMETAGGAENIDFLAKLSTALNSLGYNTDYTTVVDALHELWDAWEPFTTDETGGEVTLAPEVATTGIPQEIEYLGVPVDTPRKQESSPTAEDATNLNAYAEAMQAFNAAAESGSGAGAQIAAVMNELLTAVSNGEEIPAKLQAQAQAMLDFIESANTAGIGNDLMLGISEAMKGFGWSVPAIAIALAIETALRSAVQTNSPSEMTKPIGTDITAGIGEGMLDTASITAAAAQVSADTISAMAANMASSTVIGLNFSRGLAAGIRSGRSGVISAAASVARAAAAAAKSELDIHSPSGVTEEFGEFYDLGFIKGIKKFTPEIDDAVREALYIEPPHGAAYGGYSAPQPAPNISMPIDYERLADAMSAVQMRMYMNDRAVAEATAKETARAQNGRSRSIALGYGVKGRR